MSEADLKEDEKEGLLEVIAQVKETNAYGNYMAGVLGLGKKAENLSGEGDGFAKVGRSLKKENYPSYLKGCAKGQQKVQEALRAELKKRKLHVLLKDEELNEAIYGELYIEAGTLRKYLGKSEEEEQMSEKENESTVAETDEISEPQETTGNAEPRGEPEGQSTGDDLLSRPEYEDDFYNTDFFKSLNISGEKITKEQKAEIEKAHKKYEEHLKANPENDQTGEGKGEEGKGEEGKGEEGKGGEGQDNGEGKPKDDVLTVDSAEPATPHTEERGNVDWIEEYDKKLAQYGAANNNEWKRNREPDENGEEPSGLKGGFANGVEVHYTSKDKLSIKTPENTAPTADHFKEVVDLAKDQGQIIRLGDSMTPEFRSAFIEACAKGGVEIQNLTEEEKEKYNSFKPKEEQRAEGQQEHQEERQGDKDFLRGGYEYFNPDTVRMRYKMMERLERTPAKDTNFKEMDDCTGLDAKIASLKKAGAVIGKDSKESAELTLAEYVKASVALEDNKLDEAGKERLAALEKALGCYNLDVHKERESDGKGGETLQTVFTNKKASERSLEEQEDIKYAVLSLQPQDRKYDTDIRNMTISSIKNQSSSYTQ